MKLVARWAQVAASEARICQVRAPFGVLFLMPFSISDVSSQRAYHD
jgi:hypothetical protein